MEPRESFGAYLKSAREKKGIRLEEIASITKINLRSLEHLEAGQWKQLPPDPFLRGFIVAYAKYVGLDAREAVNLFLAEVHPNQSPLAATDASATKAAESAPVSESTRSAKPEPEKTMAPPMELHESAKTVPYKKIFIGAGAVAAVALFIVITRVGQKASEPKQETEVAKVETSDTKPAVPAAELPVLPSAAAKVEVPKEEPKRVTAASPIAPDTTKIEPKSEAKNESGTHETAAPPADIAHEVVIEGKERTWIKVVFDKEPPVEYFLPEGEKVTYRAKEKLKVVLGNSTGTKVIHNGTQVTGTKLQGTIRQYLFPDNARFPQDAASRRAASSKVVDGAATEPEKTKEEPPKSDD